MLQSLSKVDHSMEVGSRIMYKQWGYNDVCVIQRMIKGRATEETNKTEYPVCGVHIFFVPKEGTHIHCFSICMYLGREVDPFFLVQVTDNM